MPARHETLDKRVEGEREEQRHDDEGEDGVEAGPPPARARMPISTAKPADQPQVKGGRAG
jgi:hypothetical protein